LLVLLTWNCLHWTAHNDSRDPRQAQTKGNHDEKQRTAAEV
jgi:hypothetical protein